ncbi:MAG TPA: hypothetical protein PKA58_20795 [Polyangium sp.]|nr:hypothetical protein [Polyangium sp.]
MVRSTYALLILSALSLIPACGKSDDAAPMVGAEAAMVVQTDLPDAVVEEHDEGTVAMQIGADGQVRAVVTASAGGQIKENVSGSLVYKLQGGETKTVPLALEPKTGVLVAAGPKLEADLTEVNYTVQVSGKPWSGVMHVPVGGTAALVSTAKTSVDVKVDAQAVGPHGGSIQVVGDDRLEMVGDEGGEVRVYVLDADLRPRTSIEGRTLRVGFIAERPEVVAFAPASGGAYFVGRFGTRAVVDPLRVTVSLGTGGIFRSAIWGFRPGIRVIAPTATVRIAAAPRIRFRLTGGFDSGVDVYGRARTRVEFRDDDHDGKHHKGDNGRHFGQDGTFARDSGGFKSDHAEHPGGKGHDVSVRADVHAGGSHHGDSHGSKSSGGSHSSGGKSGGGHSGGGSKGGGKGGKR